MELTISKGRLKHLRVFGRDVVGSSQKSWSSPTTAGFGWWRIGESFAGAWQQNVEIRRDTMLANATVYACVKQITSDIGKMRLRMVRDRDGIWEEVREFSPRAQVLRRPNHYQNAVQFVEWWIASKLQWGNTYALKQRDGRGIVTGLYVLDPCRVRLLEAPDGSVFYQLGMDVLSGVTEGGIAVPAREIIHDRMCAFLHPLVGIPPLYAAALAATQGMAIQENSSSFFSNGSTPGGIISAPSPIPEDVAVDMKTRWEESFAGQNAGKVAVLGSGMTYEQMSMTAENAQLIDQLKWTAEDICRAFSMPAYKVNVGPWPTHGNAHVINQQYLDQCLQTLVTEMEVALDHGLEFPPELGTDFNEDDLLRMDKAALIEAEKNATGLKKVNESRRRLNLPPVDGGDTVYLQQQYYSLQALSNRDAVMPAPPSPSAAQPSEPPSKRAVITYGASEIEAVTGARLAATIRSRETRRAA